MEVPDSFGKGGIGVGDASGDLRALLVQGNSDMPISSSDDLVANSVVTKKAAAPYACTVRAIRFLTDDVPSSAGGTVLATATGGGTNLLAAANFDLEGQAAGVVSSPALSATAADLQLDQGDIIDVTMTSNNADMANGTDQRVVVEVERR